MEQVRAKTRVRVLAPAELALLLVALLATGLRLYHLGAQGLDWDEAFGIGSAYAGFGAIVHTALTVEPHPPLFYSLLRVWYHLAGSSEFALRLPSVVSSAVAVPLLFALCRRLFPPGFGVGWRRAPWRGPWVGVLAGLLWALSAEQVWYAQEERMYAPAALLCLAAVYLALRAVQSPSTRVLVCWSVVLPVALYLHYWSTFIFALLNAFVLVSCLLGRSPLKARAWLLAQVAPAVLFFPWLAAASRSTHFSLHVVDVPGELATALRLYTVGPSFPRFVLMGSLFFAALLAVGLVTSWLAAVRWRAGAARGTTAGAAGAVTTTAALLTLYAAGPLTLGLAASEVRSVFAARYLMISAPAFCVLFALGVAALWRVLPVLGLLALALAASIDGDALWNHYFNPSYLKDPFPGAVQYVDQHQRPGDAVILDSWDQQGQFWYYHVLRAGNPAPSFQFPLAGPDAASAAPRELHSIMSQHSGVWVLNWDLAPIDAHRTVQTQLATHDFQALSHAVGSNSIEYYAEAGAPVRTVPIGGTCAGNVQLRDAQVFRTSLAPGAVLPAALDWAALGSGLA
ncbi:MAG: glycosyltransferase family 39 protein, partial [Chloroflexota bacterium]